MLLGQLEEDRLESGSEGVLKRGSWDSRLLAKMVGKYIFAGIYFFRWRMREGWRKRELVLLLVYEWRGSKACLRAGR